MENKKKEVWSSHIFGTDTRIRSIIWISCHCNYMYYTFLNYRIHFNVFYLVLLRRFRLILAKPTYGNWKFRERSSNYYLVTLHQVAPAWRNLHHKVSACVKVFLSYSVFFLLSFPGHLPVDFNETSHVYSWEGGRGLIDKSLTFTVDFNISGSQPCRIICWAKSQLLLDKLSLNPNTG